MPGDMSFERYQESDAQQVAELISRNRFHAGRHKRLTAEDYLFTQRSRGVHFSIVAKKNGKIIGVAGAYPSSDQHVAKKHQVFVGTFLVDMQYRLSYSIIMGLYEGLMKGLAQSDFKEILSGVRPQNEAAYHLMLKCGFVFLDSTPNDFGRLGMRNYSILLSKYVGTESTEVSSDIFFNSLPVVDRKEARKWVVKQQLHERYIECEYILDNEIVTLLFDIVNFKIDGAFVPNYMKFYPDFGTPGRYIIENLGKSKRVSTTIEVVMQPESGLDNIKYDITLEPGQTEVIVCSKDVSELKFTHADLWYRFYPNLYEEVEVLKEPVKLDCGELSAILEPSTGFVTIMDGENKLASLVWPCATFPYLEGVNTPRIKDLHVLRQDDSVIITEETDEYKLTRECLLSENKMDVTTTLKCKTESLNVRPISQIYARKGVQGYSLRSGKKEMDFGASAIKHEGFEFTDYAYWDVEPERFADFPIDEMSLKYAASAVDVVIDKKCKPIVYAPIFTFNLDFDVEKVLEEQIIEQVKIHYRTEKV